MLRGGMMKKLDKKLVDELIRITRKYYSPNGDTDLLPAMGDAKDKLKEKCNINWHVRVLIEDLAKNSQHLNRSYQVIYDTLKLWGYEVVEGVQE